MVYLLLSGGFILSVVSVWLVVPPVRRLALRRGWVDRPDGERKLHAKPIPTLGGVVMAFGIAVGMAYLAVVAGWLPFEVALPSAGLWIGAFVMVLTGLYDDVHAAGFKQKFVVQTLVAYFMLHAGYRIEVTQLPFVEQDVYYQALYNIPLTIFWIVGIINAVNLLDGLDGLAAGVALICIASLGAVFGLRGELGVAVSALVIAGALFGFLIYNTRPATIFMGDSGSLLLGFLLATYALQAKTHADPWLALAIPVAALGLPVLETAVSFLRRLIDGRSPFAPDRDHIHHRLARATTPRQAVLRLYGVSALFGITAVLLVGFDFYRGLLLLGVVAGGVYLWLRRLGYLRVRSSLDTVKRRYASERPLDGTSPTDEAPPPRRASKGSPPRPLHAPSAEGDGSVADQYLSVGTGTNDELAGKEVLVWQPTFAPGEGPSRRLVHGLRQKGASVSVVDARAGTVLQSPGRHEHIPDTSKAFATAEVVFVCTEETVFCLQRSGSLKYP